jgi:uncharacterized protein YjbI with pentapeptide repeats
LQNARLTNADLTNAGLRNSALSNADLTGARLTGANLSFTTFGGFTKQQLYSTASYAANDLRGIVLANNDLTGWDFSGQSLVGADFGSSFLTNVKFQNANLTGAHIVGAVLTNADLSGAVLALADFGGATSLGFTKEQLYSTASHQAKNLAGIRLHGNDLAGWDFSGQNLTNAILYSTLTNANFTGAVVAGAGLRDRPSMGITREQLYSTASYQAKALQGIQLVNSDLTGWDFTEQDLTNATFYGSTLSILTGANLTGAEVSSATLVNANLTGAVVAGANFGGTRGFTQDQLYSTASYQVKDLHGIGLRQHDLAGWNFSGQNLAGASFRLATLTNVDFTGAVVAMADFGGTTSSGFTKEQLYSSASYQTKDLHGIKFGGSDGGYAWGNDLTGWNFGAQNLTMANFEFSSLAHADLSFADTRGATFLNLTSAITTNLIQPHGGITGLNLVDGTTLVAHAGVPIPVKFGADFSISPTATFDLTDNAAIVDYAETSAAAAVRHQILLGRGGAGLGKTWDGNGITSSTAAARNKTDQDSRSLGYADNATLPLGPYTSFHGAPVDGTSVLIAYTRTGDANLDGVVNDDDVTIVGATYSPGVPQPSWALGDFDYNGFVDDDDVTLLNAFYDPSAAPLNSPFANGDSSLPAPPGAVGGLDSDVVAVPEPSTLVLLLAVLTLAALASAVRLFRFFHASAPKQIAGLACAIAVISTSSARAQIYRRDTGELIPGTQGITPGPGVRLDYLDLECADLADCDLSGASFVGSSLRRACLTKANLARSDLTGACLESANLTGADLSGADLTGACFRRSVLTNANLLDAVVTKADFRQAAFTGFTIEHVYSILDRRTEEAIERLGARDQLRGADQVLDAGWAIVPFNRGRQLRLGLRFRTDDSWQPRLW